MWTLRMWIRIINIWCIVYIMNSLLKGVVGDVVKKAVTQQIKPSSSASNCEEDDTMFISPSKLLAYVSLCYLFADLVANSIEIDEKRRRKQNRAEYGRYIANLIISILIFITLIILFVVLPLAYPISAVIIIPNSSYILGGFALSYALVKLLIYFLTRFL